MHQPGGQCGKKKARLQCEGIETSFFNASQAIGMPKSDEKRQNQDAGKPYTVKIANEAAQRA